MKLRLTLALVAATLGLGSVAGTAPAAGAPSLTPLLAHGD
jgi:uncharacterized membrane protein YtjA (UPF0391 family)